MFDNNNDQIFGNRNPIFNNNIEKPNYNDQFQPINKYDGLNFEPSQTQSNLFGLNNLGYQDIPKSFESQDLPPMLDEIKNLNDAVRVEAPTLDVLGPMNIMPEKDPVPNDPLTNYEAGNFNFNNNAVDNSILNNSFDSSVMNLPQPFNNNLEQRVINNYKPNDFDPAFQTNLTYPKLDKETFETPKTFDLNFKTDFDALSSFPSAADQISVSPFTESAKSSIEDVETKLEPMQFNSIIEQEKGIEEPTDLNKINENSLPEIIEDINLSTDESKDYSIINDSINNIEETELSKLGLDDSYSEPDILEIMDIDSEEDNINSDVSTIELSSNAVMANVNKIKELIDSFKEAGIKVDLEEFDFETMYQITIKFNK